MSSRQPKHKPPPKALTEADRYLQIRAASLYQPYSALKLSLTRFAWGAKGVEARARQKIIRWANAVVDGCTQDALALGVPPERYLRNLLPLLSEWIAPLLVAVLRHEPALRRKLPGLKLQWLLLQSDDRRLVVFEELLASPRPQPCPPSNLITFIRLSNGTLDKAWIRWLVRSDQKPGAREALLHSSSDWIDRAKRLSVIFSAAGLGHEQLAPMLDPQPSTRPLSNAKAPPRLVWQERPAIRRTDSTPVAPSKRIPAALQSIWPRLLWTLDSEKPAPEIIRAFVVMVSKDPKLARWSDRELRAHLTHFRRTTWPLEVPKEPLPSSKFSVIQSLTIGCSGHKAAIEYLNRLRPSHLRIALDMLGPHKVRLLALYLWQEIDAEQKETISTTVVLQILQHIAATLPGGFIARLLLDPAMRRGNLRKVVLERMHSLSSEEYGDFLASTGPLDLHWKRLPILFREEILDLWLRHKPQISDAAGVSINLILDAARWGGDHGALVYVFLGPQPEKALPLLREWTTSDEKEPWQNFLQHVPKKVPLPEHTLQALAKKKNLLDVFLRDALTCFRGAKLQALDPVNLFPYALKQRWLADEMEAAFTPEGLAKTHAPLKKAFASRQRKWAAVELALLLGPRYATSLHYLSTRSFAQNAGTRFDNLYHSWALPKRKGGNRIITAPKPFLKSIQRALLRTFFAKAPLHPAATGFREGFSIADNARPHVGQSVVVNVDISGFFPNTRFPLVARAIESALPKFLSPETRRLVTDICCHGGVLPTGAPTSPAIANLVLLRADRAISVVSARKAINYTRYADDLTFSGNDPVNILPFVRDVLAGLGYELDKKKTNIFRKGRRQVVTGLVVNDKVSVPRLMRRKLRAAVYRAANDDTDLTWHKAPMSLSELEGRIAFTAIAHREQALNLLVKLRATRGGKDGR